MVARRKGVIAPLAISLLLLLGVACQSAAAPAAKPTTAPQPTAAPTSAPAAAPTSAPAAAKPTAASGAPATAAQPAAAAQTQSDDELIAKAKQEGEVVIYLGRAGSRQMLDAFKPFEEKYGIKATPVIGSGSENAAKALAERDTGLYSGDVWMGGLTTMNTTLLPKGAFDPIDPLLQWPEVKDASTQLEGHRWYGDKDNKYIILFSATVSNLLAYNTDLVNPDEFKSWYDLLDPKWKGKIVAHDPTLAGGASVMSFFYFNPDLGPEYLKRIYTEQNVTIVADSRQGAEWLALGKFALEFIPAGSDTTDMSDQGLPVKDFLRPLKEGGQIAASGTGTLAVMNKAAHPNAAKLFVNWFLSKEGQIAAMTANPLDESLRQDVPKNMVREERRRVAGAKYQFTDADPNSQGSSDQLINFMKSVINKE
jgi:iron(III) transport system substrate-binding protein